MEKELEGQEGRWEDNGRAASVLAEMRAAGSGAGTGVSGAAALGGPGRGWALQSVAQVAGKDELPGRG